MHALSQSFSRRVAVLDAEELEKALAVLLLKSEGSQYFVHLEESAAEKLTPEQALLVLFIVQSAMSRGVRRLQARAGLISLRMLKQCVRCAVSDKGVGCNVPGINGRGHRLRDIAARARQMGARLRVISERGHGMRIILDICKDAVCTGP